MNNQVFIPVTDDIIYNHPEAIEGPLVPYAAGMECHEWLSIEINPEESELELASISSAAAKTENRNSGKLRLAYSA